MLHQALPILLINAYWLTLPLIGYAILLFLNRRNWNSLGSLLSFVLQQPFLAIVFFAFSLTSAVLGIFALGFYLMQASVVVFAWVYLVLLLASLGYLLLLFAKSIFSVSDVDIFQLRNVNFLARLIFAGLGLLLLLDYGLSLYVGSYVLNSADSYVHLSRIIVLLRQGFSIESGYLKGLPETGYHYNLIYALYALPAYLLHQQPFVVWRDSLGFFRFIEWAAMFALAWHAVRHWLGIKEEYWLLAASLATIFAVSCFSAMFFAATYPNETVIAWLVLLIIGLSYYGIERTGPALSISVIAAFLATVTHPTYAMMAALLIGLVLVLMLLRELLARAWRVADWACYGSLIVVLMLGPIRTALFPNKLTTDQQHLADFPVISWGPFSIKRPDLLLHSHAIDIALSLLGSAGFIYLLIKLWRRPRQWALVCGLIIFFPIVMYEPIGFTILSRLLPLWLLGRFISMNILVFIAAPLGVYAIGRLVYHEWARQSSRRNLIGWERAAQLAASVVLLGMSAVLVIPSHQALLKDKSGNIAYYSFMQRIHDNFGRLFVGQKIVVANQGDSYLLSAVAPVKVLAIEEGHMSLLADYKDRHACQDDILGHFSYADLKSVGASYIVLAKYEAQYKQLRMVADSKPYLQPSGEDEDFYVYAFNKSRLPSQQEQTPDLACTQFPLVESGR